MLNLKPYNNVDNIEKLTKYFATLYPATKALNIAQTFFTSEEISKSEKLTLIGRLGLMSTTGTGIQFTNKTIVINNNKKLKH